MLHRANFFFYGMVLTTTNRSEERSGAAFISGANSQTPRNVLEDLVGNKQKAVAEVGGISR